MMQRIQIWPVIVVKPLDGLREHGLIHGVMEENAFLVWYTLIVPEPAMVIPSVMVRGALREAGRQNVLPLQVRCHS